MQLMHISIQYQPFGNSSAHADADSAAGTAAGPAHCDTSQDPHAQIATPLQAVDDFRAKVMPYDPFCCSTTFTSCWFTLLPAGCRRLQGEGDDALLCQIRAEQGQEPRQGAQSYPTVALGGISKCVYACIADRRGMHLAKHIIVVVALPDTPPAPTHTHTCSVVAAAGVRPETIAPHAHSNARPTQ